MKIIESDLDGFGGDLVTKCLGTRRDRVGAYNGLKHYFLWGAQEGDQAPYNKIYPHLDLLTAFLYSQATVEYDISVSDQPEAIFRQAGIMSKRLNMYFHDHGVADMFGEALLWALVYNSTIAKFNWNKHSGLEPYLIEPHNFGVLREDVPDLNRQEAFVQSYMISEAELKRRISGLPNSADIMKRITARPVQSDDTFPESVNRIIVAGTVDMTSSTTRGMVNVPDVLGQLQYKPKTSEDLVEMYELWAWDDDKEDYRTITLADPGVVIYGRKDIGNLLGIKGEHPFIKICPNPLYDYFWGWSEITNLVRLQDWSTERLRDIRRLLQLQANPPKSFTGFGGISDEKFAAMGSPGAWMSEQTPGAKVEQLTPEVPADLFQDIVMITNMFNDESGLSDILQGKGETGVRAKGHADILAKLGSARIKKRALSVEKTLEQMGELVVKIMKAKDDFIIKAEGIEPFVAAQFTEDYQVHVDAHSASPVFVDDHVQLAFGLAKAGAIDADSLLELTRPPKVDTLRARQKKLKAERDAKIMQMAQAGQLPGGKKGPRAA